MQISGFLHYPKFKTKCMNFKLRWKSTSNYLQIQRCKRKNVIGTIFFVLQSTRWMRKEAEPEFYLYIFFFKSVKSNFIAIPSFAGRAAVAEVSQSQKALVSSGEVILTPSAHNTKSKRWDPLAAISGCDFLIKACQKLMLITGSCLNFCLKVARYTFFAEVDFVQTQCSWARNASPSLPDFVLRNHKVALQMGALLQVMLAW